MVVESKREGLCVVAVQGDLETGADAVSVRTALQAAACSGRQAVVDLSRVEFLAPLLLAELLLLEDPELPPPWLVGPLRPAVRRLLDMTKAGPRFRMFASLEDAALAAQGEGFTGTRES